MKTYRYIDGEYEVRSEIKRSLFIAAAKGEVDAESAEEFVKAVRKRYPDATHNCYAYISDELGNVTRFSDDGEPSGTAGQPILDVLKKQGLVKSAIVVTRYFGGVKLGAGGLVGAYSGAASDVVKSAKISQKTECAEIEICAGYSDFAALEKYIRKAECFLYNVNYGDDVFASVYVPLDGVEKFLNDVRELSAGRAKTRVSNEVAYQSIL
ncbi:MAG: YigZ family protein [Bacteroides sp.]|nr:YigZ family protein [Bacillota bacterium]MCM1394301.1 YigZ family protein [[Eubacterium] siraeum]MCM1455615.1 YigZ family protein [Bacteroides sp.]